MPVLVVRWGSAMNLSLRFGQIRVSPWMFLLGIVVHFFVPAFLLFEAHRMDLRWGWTSNWPLWVRLPPGAIIFVLSVALEAACMPKFFRLGGTPSPFQPTQSLIIAGPYRYCRHPIYVAYIGYVIGLGVMLGSQSIFLLAGIWWLALAAQARFVEEPLLRRRFGEQFETYRRSTPFMIPRLWRHR